MTLVLFLPGEGKRKVVKKISLVLERRHVSPESLLLLK